MRKSSLLSIFLVYFFDNFSLAVVFPLFSSLMLIPHFDIVPLSENLAYRTAMLGVLIAAFPLALFIGAPIMGNFSDHFGRRRTFLFTVSAAVIGNLVTAFALHIHSYVLLLICRLFCGFVAGNLTLCLATLSDLNPTQKGRAKSFGYLTAVGGLSWILAMIAGGDLSYHALSPNFSPSLPFLIIAGIGALNLGILYFLFPETHQRRTPLLLSPKKILAQLFEAFLNPRLRILYATQCFFLIGWMLIFQWFSGYTYASFSIPREITSISLTIIGLFWILGATFLNRTLLGHVELKKIPLYGMVLLTALFIVTSFFPEYRILVTLDSLNALITSLVMANLFNLISLTALKSNQGNVMGLSQSVMTLAQSAAPLIGTQLPIRDIPAYYYGAAIASAIAVIVYQTHKTRRTAKR